jgi:hypothetical protein
MGSTTAPCEGGCPNSFLENMLKPSRHPPPQKTRRLRASVARFAFAFVGARYIVPGADMTRCQPSAPQHAPSFRAKCPARLCLCAKRRDAQSRNLSWM